MYWYNGKLIKSQTLELDIYEPGLLYGATIFTTLRIYNNSLDSNLTNWQAHSDRLQHSIQTFNWQQPDWNSVYQGAKTLSTHFPVLRITIFPDGREWIIGRFLPENLAEIQKHGIIAALTKPELARSLPSHKTGNYLSPWLAKNSVKTQKAEEAILVDTAGNWLETSTGNLWGYKDGHWWTPPLDTGILPGIGRSQLIKQLQNVIQEPWTPEIAQEFEAIAYTNSVMEIIPIHTVQQPTGLLKYNPYHPSFFQLRRFFLT
ncbi:aminotransferase class IV [Cronbergia sp. UHCC 0137]|uniref:aminotransferase class IV n=1 Tax=Cronbergia sp. UHCC 0137 TaxID=3110239 RepID=UPI002B1F0F61|nr:aminotransferase class IV [Cronbergia sp. UHCC 0137]MEA5620270.1 aminotransferase class IV [Cronbergia sp. UHCC 0137]